jgi:hypothetical protein
VTRGLDLSGLVVDRAVRVRAPATARTLILGEDGPLLLALEEPRALLFLFELGASNLASLPDFPRLARRAVAWLFRPDELLPEPVGLLDVAESALAPLIEATEPAPVRWRRQGMDLSLVLAFLALAAWTARSWIRP